VAAENMGSIWVQQIVEHSFNSIPWLVIQWCPYFELGMCLLFKYDESHPEQDPNQDTGAFRQIDWVHVDEQIETNDAIGRTILAEVRNPISMNLLQDDILLYHSCTNPRGVARSDK
jgi:hypothetical protein